MKNYMIFLLVFSSILMYSKQGLFSQNDQPWHLRRAYVNIGGGNQLSYIHFHTIFNNGWAIVAGWDEGATKSKNLPSDYLPEIFYATIFGNTGENKVAQSDEYNTISFGMGKVLTKPSDQGWVMATAAFAFGTYYERHFFKQERVNYDYWIASGITSNYGSTVESNKIFGLRTGVQGHVNLGRFVGLSAGVQGLISNFGFIPHYNISANLGLMRPKKENMIKRH